MIIDHQVALDEALVPHASRLRIGKSNFRLRSDITSKESTLQLVYDVLRLTLFYKAFLTFDKLPFEEEILAFLRYLGHSEEIKMITDVNINKLHQPWRSFAAVINKCLSEKSTGYDSLRHQKLCCLQGVFAIASGATPPKIKASVRKTQSSFDTKMPPPTAAGTRLSTSAKGKQLANSSKAKGLSVISEVAMTEAKQMKLDTKRILQQTHISQASRSGANEGTGIQPRVLDVPTYEFDEEISWKSSDEDDDDEVDDRNNDGDEFVHPKLSIHDNDDQEFEDEQNFDDEGNDDAGLGMNVSGEEGHDADDDDEELYRDVNINFEGRDVQMTDIHTTQEFEDTHVTLTPVNLDGIDSLFELTPRVDVQASTIVAPPTLTAPTLPPPTIPTISQVPQAPTPPTALSTFLQDLPNFARCSNSTIISRP
nr:hypothetical protein [Tanacetum cinerariifolium]